jgi:nucleoside-diphosphate-sugar epimerase
LKIIVTGANGFIGRHLISSLKTDKAEVSAYNGDVLRFSEIQEKYDTVVHLASVTGNEYMNADRKKRF